MRQEGYRVMKKNRFSEKALSFLLSLLFLFSAFAGLNIGPAARADYEPVTINFEAVAAVKAAIDNIGTVEFTAECCSLIKFARDTYDAFNDIEKWYVTNYDVLVAAENEFYNLSRGHNTAVRLIVDGAVDGMLDTHENRVYFGNYCQTSADYTEPIKWRILDHSGGMMLLLSDKNLAVKPYHISPVVNVPWTSCTLRTWLNGSDDLVSGGTDDSFFANAFNATEQMTVSAVNPDTIGTSGSASQGGTYTDKVFILSSGEAMNPAFGFPEATNASGTRAAECTEFAKNSDLARIGNTWWLRDTDSVTSRWVTTTGLVVASSDTGSYIQSDCRGIRPALYTGLSRVLFASPATGGKTSEGALTNIPEYSGKEWKLTVRNNSYRFTVSETSATAGRGETVTLNYTRAKYGENDRISAILVNGDGQTLYYGQIAHPTAAAGLVDIRIPQDIAPGNYTLKIFNEQLNGDYATDFASAFSDISLTVPCDHLWSDSWSWTGDFVPELTLTCGTCGAAEKPEVTVTSEVTEEPALGQTGKRVYSASAVFEGLTYTDTATEILPEVSPVGAYSLTLDGRIGVNFYIDIPDPDPYACVVFNVDGKYEHAFIDTEEFTTVGETKLWKFTCGVAAAQIDTPITGVIDLDGKECTFTYSVQEYLTELKNDPELNTDPLLMELAGAVATYGYYANELFATNPGFTQHELFDDSGMADVTAESLEGYRAQISNTADGVIYLGSSLVLRTETAVRHYFSLPEDKTINDFSFRITGNKKIHPFPMEKSDGLYFVEIPNIPSAKLGAMQKLEVWDIYGETVNSWNYSPMSYVYAALKKYEANDPAVSDELADVTRALALYYRAADAYFSAHSISFLLTPLPGWDRVYVYGEDENGEPVSGEYPGEMQTESAVNEYGETQYVIRLPEDAVLCVISNGRGDRTEDITDFGCTGYWMDGTQNSSGNYRVCGWY